jgi:signal transduction histidine kinase
MSPLFEIFEKSIVILINTIGIWLGFWVWNSARKEKLNQWFGIMTFFILLWVSFAYLGYIAKEVPQAIFWYRLNFGSVSLFLFSAYYFYVFYFLKVRNIFLERLILSCSLLFFFFSIFTDLIIKDAIIQEWGAEIIFGKLGVAFCISALFIAVFVLYYGFTRYFLLSKEQKLKVQYFLVGIIIFVFLNIIFNVVYPSFTYTVKYSRFADYSAILFLGFTAYAIVKRELFGIRVVLTTLFVGLIAVLMFLDTVVLTRGLSLQIIKGITLAIFLYFGYLLIKSVLLEIQRRQEIEKIDKAKSEFISIASHQLRTPLTAVKGYISMILEGTYGQLAEKQARPLENVYRSNERLIKLINDLLNLSRLEVGKIEFSPELTSLEKVVADIVEEIKINAEKKGLYMKTVKPSKPLPEIMVDQDKLRQVILNIIDNAIKYTNRGGITIELKKLDGEEEIKVSDTGEGMDEKELNSLFQMFSRATAGTQLHTEGAGLGLYVARQFIEMHGGKIWAESPGKSKGSTFYIRLPIHLDPKLLKTKTKTITKAPNDIF